MSQLFTLKYWRMGLTALIAVLVAAQAPAQQQVTAIAGVTVLPMTGVERLENQTVLLQGDRIVRVGPRAGVRFPRNAHVIDGAGLTLMPGLVDMHVHLAPEQGRPGDAAQRALAVMLAHGVTTARGMAGSPANLVVRDGIERGAIIGPRIYAAAPALHGNNTATPEAAREAVRKARQEGYDLIKSHQLTDVAVWQAVQDEAKRVGLPTAGHVTNQVGLPRAMAAGQQIEHLDGTFFELLAPNAPERAIDFAQIPPPPVMAAAAKASDAAIQSLARKAAAQRSYQVPTLALFEKIVDLARPTEELRNAPDMRFVPEAALLQWAAQREQLRASGLTAEQASLFKRTRQRLVRAYAQAGVPIMAGSDTAQAFHIWGPGLIQEIEALAAAGLSRMDALRSATVVPRNYLRSLRNAGSSLGWKANFGTVEAGARADLILLHGDPSRDLAALRNLDTVIAAGRVHDRRALDAMLARAATDAKATRPAAAAAVLLPKQVFVMRHLDTETGAKGDPALTTQGMARAARLATLLKDNGIAAIYVTATRRSHDTSAPLAQALGLTPTVYDPRNPEALVKALAGQKGNVLVVAHSNTAPDIVSRLGGSPPAAIGERDFGRIWVIDTATRATREWTIDRPSATLTSPSFNDDHGDRLAA